MAATTERLRKVVAALRPAHNLRTRVAWLIGGSGVVLAILLIAVADQALRTQAIAQEVRGLGLEARLLRRALETALAERVDDLKNTAANPILAGGTADPGDVRLLLEAFRSQEPSFAWIAFVDTEGRVQVATGTLGEGMRVNGERWFEESRRAPYIGPRRDAGFVAPRMGYAGGEAPSTIDVGAPVVNSAGRPIGALLARLRADWIDELHASLRDAGHEWPGIESAVLDREGTMLVRSSRGVNGLSTVSLKDESPAGIVQWAGEGDFVTAWSREAGAWPGLTVILRRPAALAFEAADVLRAELLVLGTAVIAAFVVLSVWLAQQFARPIQELSAAALRVVDHEPMRFTALPARRTDEVAQLARALETLHRELSTRLVERERAAERYQGLFRNTPVAILVFQAGRVWMANEACRALFGVERAEALVGRTVSALVHAADHPRFARADAPSLALGHDALGGEPEFHRIVRADGSIAHVESTTMLVALDEGMAVQVAMRDLTLQREAEAMLVDLNERLEQRVAERTSELTAANAELDAFAYAVSHDLRGPLRAVGGYAFTLIEDHAAELSEEARRSLDRITAAAARMTELVDGLLTLSRSGRGQFEKQRVDIGALVDSAIAELRHLEPQRKVRVEVAPEIFVAGDRCMLSAAVGNLVGNAWKYTAGREDALIEVFTEEQGGERWICFRDNGAGFDPAHAGRLYQPFARMHRQDEFPGLGIGLATVARIVKRHDGRIEAESAPGRGACFRVLLPGNVVTEAGA